MVSTTTQPNASAPGPGVMTASEPKRTSATVRVTTKTSSIDHRPIFSTIRYSVVRWRGRHLEPDWVAQVRNASVPSLSIGTRTLAMKMIAASG